jgi:hypothetical protein
MDPGDVVDTQLSSDGGARTYQVRSTLRNHGEAHAYGVVVVLTGVTKDVTQGPVLLQRHLVDLPAGGSAELTARVTYPAGYGLFVVQVQFTGDGGPFSDSLSEEDAWGATVFRVINPEGAPPAFAKWAGDMLCASQCRGY